MITRIFNLIMDTLNDYLQYPTQAEYQNISDSEMYERQSYKSYLLETRVSKNYRLDFDDWCLVYSDDLWYMWCNICDYTMNSSLRLFDNLKDYSSFCSMCYENSTKL